MHECSFTDNYSAGSRYTNVWEEPEPITRSGGRNTQATRRGVRDETTATLPRNDFALNLRDGVTSADDLRAYDAEAYAAGMSDPPKLSKKLNLRGLSKQQEAFCVLVAQGTPTTEAVEQVYPDNSSPSRYARELQDSAKVTNRIEVLENQRNLIAELNRDSLTVRALEIEGLATENGKYSAGVSALRLVGDLQGLTNEQSGCRSHACVLGVPEWQPRACCGG